MSPLIPTETVNLSICNGAEVAHFKHFKHFKNFSQFFLRLPFFSLLSPMDAKCMLNEPCLFDETAWQYRQLWGRLTLVKLTEHKVWSRQSLIFWPGASSCSLSISFFIYKMGIMNPLTGDQKNEMELYKQRTWYTEHAQCLSVQAHFYHFLLFTSRLRRWLKEYH